MKMGDNSFIQNLEKEAIEIRNEDNEISKLKEKLDERRGAINSREKHWRLVVDLEKKNVSEGKLTTGEVIRDYVFIHDSFYSAENFLNSLNSSTKSLRETLNKLSSTKRFWFEKTTYEKDTKIYELMFLGENPYSITAKNITLDSLVGFTVSILPVFSGKNLWAFFNNEPEKKIIVEYEKFRSPYDTPILATSTISTDTLEKRLESNPVALAGFRKRLNLKISASLQKQLAGHTHDTALDAFNVIQEQYRIIKGKDKEVQEIEEQYNSSQRETGMFATRPVIIDPEPDPVLARIMSYDARSEREWALRRLAQHIYNLDRTHLSDYSQSIKTSIGPGEEKICNLAEYSNYIRHILEISCKKEKVRV